MTRTTETGSSRRLSVRLMTGLAISALVGITAFAQPAFAYYAWPDYGSPPVYGWPGYYGQPYGYYTQPYGYYGQPYGYYGRPYYPRPGFYWP